MEDTLDRLETLRRYAVTMERLCAPCYPLAVMIAVDTDDPSRLDEQDGKPLKQCGLIVSDNDRWEGDVLATVLLRDLQLDDDYIWPLAPLLKRGSDLVDLWGEALLQSHLDDFERFSTHVAPSAWERGCTNAVHGHFGLTLMAEDDDEPQCLLFKLHASAIAGAVNERLKRAAEQGGME
jgi:hypothetical protein